MAIVKYIEKGNAERAKFLALEIQAKTNSLPDFSLELAQRLDGYF